MKNHNKYINPTKFRISNTDGELAKEQKSNGISLSKISVEASEIVNSFVNKIIDLVWVNGLGPEQALEILELLDEPQHVIVYMREVMDDRFRNEI